MSRPNLSPRAVIAGIASVSLVIAGGAASGVAYAHAAKPAAPAVAPSAGVGDAPVNVEKPIYPTNDAGETYGSAADAPTPEDEPDLIKVMATNGKIGYARSIDLDRASGVLVANPEEALAWTEDAQERAASGEEVSVPVYEVDGKTVIGKFVIG